jgi:hypothetical protein
MFYDIVKNNHYLQQKIQIGNNEILSVNYSISNSHPKLFDIVEYTVTLKTTLNELNLKNINIVFNTYERIKVIFIY